ncbi:unnamed protein product [Discosporangium mesarthrocarpum]
MYRAANPVCQIRYIIVTLMLFAGAEGTASNEPPPAIPLRNDLGSMSLEIDTTVPDAQSYFDQGLRFTSAFKFDFGADNHRAAIALDPDCAMCYWGLAYALGQNLNDALVMALEPSFLANEPLAYEAINTAAKLASKWGEGGSTSTGGGQQTPPSLLRRARDTALIEALRLKFVPTEEEFASLFVDGLPRSLNQAYSAAMSLLVKRADLEGWPSRDMVRTFAADSLMNLSPWDYWESPKVMRPNARAARDLLEAAMEENSDNPWPIHLYTHLMEAGDEAALAVPFAKRLQFLVPGAPHLQHMQSHVEFRTGEWHNASEANERAVALPFRDASYPDHNMDMLIWALRAEGRLQESKDIGKRLSAYSLPRVRNGVYEPLLPPERYLAQEPLNLAAFADWEAVLALAPPPPEALFVVAVHHFARSLAFLATGDWESYHQEQSLITVDVPAMEERGDYYGVYPAPTLARIVDLISQAEALRAGLTPLQTVMGTPLSEGEAAPGQHRAEEIRLLRAAVKLEDSIGYDEPPAMYLPTRLYLGAALLRDGQASAARDGFAAVARAHPGMGWTLVGQAEASAVLGDSDAAREFLARFEASWGLADVWLEDPAHVGGQVRQPSVTHDTSINEPSVAGSEAAFRVAAVLEAEGGMEGVKGGDRQGRVGWLVIMAGFAGVCFVVLGAVLARRAARFVQGVDKGEEGRKYDRIRERMKQGEVLDEEL